MEKVGRSREESSLTDLLLVNRVKRITTAVLLFLQAIMMVVTIMSFVVTEITVYNGIIHTINFGNWHPFITIDRTKAKIPGHCKR